MHQSSKFKVCARVHTLHVHVNLASKDFDFLSLFLLMYCGTSVSGDVQPLLCIVQLDESKSFEAKFKEAYIYETVGGNNSRLALQELLQERPKLCTNKLYSHRLCSVYRRMEAQLVLRLASKHNRDTTTYTTHY